MTGRIKLLRDGEAIQKDADMPELGYDYDQPAEHDEVCGTFGVHEFQLPNNECPEKFVCDVPSDNVELAQFSNCIDSMNCAMMNGMTSSVEGSESEDALFIHQMIPHHQNAVNMAKALLKTGKVQCDDLTDEESDQADDCSLEIILREVINVQNAQIQVMRGLLDSHNYPAENDCEVLINPGIGSIPSPNNASPGLSSSTNTESTGGNDGICEATCTSDAATGEELCTFTTKVNLFAGELGYYQFEECGDATNPMLGLEVGKTYEFIQKDPSNYYHPLGFAYYPDGAHADADELEPGIAPPQSSSACAADMTCPAPMYYIGGEYVGSYSNNGDFGPPVTTDDDNFGLDDYEPLFFHPLPEWLGYGEFSVFLKFDGETDFTKDIFYFCHIHQFMTGRIKLLRDGEPIQEDADLPELGYEYNQPAEHDQVCGTYGVDEFQLPHNECPEQFVCDVPAENVELVQFSQCVESMNCAMMSGMTTSVQGSESEVALFLHQMIPHHQNAVNMAKALLKSGKVQCDDLTDEESEQADACALEIITREIINNQNAQIQVMRGLLDSKSYPAENDCEVPMSSYVITAPTVDTTQVLVDIQVEPPISSEDTTGAATSEDEVADPVSTTITPIETSSVSKENSLTSAAVVITVLSLCWSVFGV